MKFIKYLSGVKEELGKVSWPSKDEVVQATTLVVSFALILSVIVWGFDWVSSLLIGKLL